MKVSVIIAHPNKKSFNHAVAEVAVQTLKATGHEVVYHDLYEEDFDPVLSLGELQKTGRQDKAIERHCAEIASADGIVVVHPNWWGQPPAILKGWVDRVLREGVAYEFAAGDKGDGVPAGLLKAQMAVVFNTSDTHEIREMMVFGDPLETLWKNCVFGLCGVKNFYRVTFRVVANSSQRKRTMWLKQARGVVKRFFPPDGGVEE